MGRKTIDGVSYPDLSTFKVNVGTADVYSFRFEEPFGWAIFTINNATGEFHIQSDWGQWQFRWNLGALGESSEKHPKPLAHFIGNVSGPHYIVDKLGYGKSRKFTQTFDDEATKATIRRLIFAARLEHEDIPEHTADLFYSLIKKDASGHVLADCHTHHPLSHEDAKRLRAGLDEWFDRFDFNSETAQLMAIDGLRYENEELYDFLTCKNKRLNMIDREIWELFEHRPSWECSFLIEVLIPFFIKYLRENVLNDDASARKTA